MEPRSGRLEAEVGRDKQGSARRLGVVPILKKYADSKSDFRNILYHQVL
jgi:hypothetical protein